MHLSKALDGFRIDRLGSSYSEGTINMYLCYLNVLCDYVKDKDVADISRKDLKGYLYYLRKEYQPRRLSRKPGPLAEGTIDNHVIAIRSFFNWYSKEFKIKRPDKDIKQPQYQSLETIPFSR